MQLAKAVNRKLIIVKHDLNIAVSWTQQILLSFTPDIMIVRQIVYSAAVNPELRANELRTDLIKDNGPICIFTDRTSVAPQSEFIMGSTINGTYNFDVRLLDGAPSTGVGDLMVALEFVEYEKKQ